MPPSRGAGGAGRSGSPKGGRGGGPPRKAGPPRSGGAPTGRGAGGPGARTGGRQPAPLGKGRPGGAPNRSGDPRVGRATTDPKGLGGEQVEGRNAVRELLRVGKRRVREVWIVEDVDHAPVITEIEKLAAKRRTPVRYVTRGKLERESKTESPQGVLALASAIQEADLDDLVRARHGGGRLGAFLLLLDGVTDPHNLGAVLRSAEYAGITGAVLPRHRAAHVTPTVAKASAGAIEHVPMAIVPGLPAAMLGLQKAGVWSVGLDQDAPTSIYDLDLGPEPIALVLGAEGSGMGQLTRRRCDTVVSIPRAGRLDSLNVSAAAAIALFEVARRRAALLEDRAPAEDAPPLATEADADGWDEDDEAGFGEWTFEEGGADEGERQA